MNFTLQRHDLPELMDKPGIDSGQFVDGFNRHTLQKRIAQVKYALRIGRGQFLIDFRSGRQTVFDEGVCGGIFAVSAQSMPADFQRAQPLLEGFFKCSADGHCFAHGFHRCRQKIRRFGKFFKGPARHFDHTVIQGRFKRSQRLTGNIVGYFIKGIADRELGGNFCNRKARRLGRQG